MRALSIPPSLPACRNRVISTGAPPTPRNRVISTGAPPTPRNRVISTGAQRSGEIPAFRPIILLLLLALACFTPARTASAQQHISGQATLALTQQYVDAAPKRWIGSKGHTRAETFIKAHFAPEIAKGTFETDSFSASTPAGLLPMRNYIVKYPSQNPAKRDGIIVLATHYETNYPLRDINFIGANDGASTTALLIEIGSALRAHPPEGYSVWLVFDDGEEAIHNWTDRDSLYGTRHLAAKWSNDGTLAKIKAFLVADMIGYKELNIDRDGNSTPWLLDMLATAAKNTGHSSSVFRNETAVEDDHMPFRQRGVPVLDIIDLDYGPPTREHPEGGFHHTELDTMDKLSARSLQTAGDLFLEMIRLINQRP